MIRSLTTVKRRGLQFAVTLMSAALLIGMSAGLTGSKAFAATKSGTTNMYNWDFSTGAYTSDFNANTLTSQQGASITSGQLVLGPVDSSKVATGDPGKYCTMQNSIMLGSKYESNTWRLSMKLAFPQALTGFGNNILEGPNGGITIKRPLNGDKYDSTSTTLIILISNDDGVLSNGRAAYIPNVSDDTIKAGIIVDIYMNAKGGVRVDLAKADGTSIAKGVAVSKPNINSYYDTESTFSFDQPIELNHIGTNNAYCDNTVINYIRFNTTANADKTYTNSITGATVNTANITANGAAVKAVDNGDGTATYSGQLYGDVNNDGTISEAITKNADGTFAFSGANYKYNTSTKKFEVVAASASTGTGTGTTVTPVKITVAKATISKAAVGKKSVKTTWKKISNATGYQVSVNTKKSGTKIVKTITSGKTVTFNKTGLKKGKVYYVSVRAFNTTNGTTTYGSWSSVKKTAKVK